ncbi:MAG: hypothetical protein ACYSUX_08045 [Planctomycetota bacterium]
MKRAIYILIVVLAAMLVYPSADLLAKSPKSTDTPTKQIIPPRDNPVIPGIIVDNDGDDEDSGDADDIAGLPGRDKMKGPENSSGNDLGTARLLVKIWWMYFFHRIF